MARKGLLSTPIVAHALLIASVACGIQAHDLPAGSAGHLASRQKGPREQFGAIPYGTTIEACNNEGQIALTFDDGPGSLTGELLDLLESKRVNVTFFITGDHDEGSIDDESTDKPGILRRMLQDGHQIASHGWSHKDLNAVDEKTRREEVVLNEKAFANVLGIMPTYFRPPFGRCDDGCNQLLGELGYHNVQWDTDTDDWKKNVGVSKARYSGAVQQQLSALVLAHDIQEPTVRQLAEFMIDEARDLGFQLVTVGECLGDSRQNWYRDAKSGGQWRPGNVFNEVSQSLAADEEEATSTESTESTPESSTATAMTLTSISDVSSIEPATTTPATTTATPSSSQTGDDTEEASATEETSATNSASATGDASDGNDDDGDDDGNESGVGALRSFSSGALCAMTLSFAATALLGPLF